MTISAYEGNRFRGHGGLQPADRLLSLQVCDYEQPGARGTHTKQRSFIDTAVIYKSNFMGRKRELFLLHSIFISIRNDTEIKFQPRTKPG